MNRGNCSKISVGGQSGLSIIEIMIALLLGALLTVGLVQVFTSNSQSFRVNEATARAQESGRMSVDMLARAVRNAGYFGCFPVNGIVNNLDVDGDNYDASLHEFQMEGIFSHSTARPAGAVAGTDWFRLSGLRNGGVNVHSEANINSVVFDVNDTAPPLVDGAVIMVSDCNNGDIFQLTSDPQALGGGQYRLQANSGNGEPGNDFSENAPPGCSSGSNCFSAVYPAGAQILFPYNEIYYIGVSGSSGRNALYVIDSMRNPGVSVELVDGVEDMAVRYGTGTAESGVTGWQANADLISDWGSVIAVEISLLVRSGPDGLFDQAINACFPSWTDCSGGNNYTAPNNGLYRVYSFTTALRNRI